MIKSKNKKILIVVVLTIVVLSITIVSCLLAISSVNKDGLRLLGALESTSLTVEQINVVVDELNATFATPDEKLNESLVVEDKLNVALLDRYRSKVAFLTDHIDKDGVLVAVNKYYSSDNSPIENIRYAHKYKRLHKIDIGIGNGFFTRLRTLTQGEMTSVVDGIYDIESYVDGDKVAFDKAVAILNKCLMTSDILGKVSYKDIIFAVNYCGRGLKNITNIYELFVAGKKLFPTLSEQSILNAPNIAKLAIDIASDFDMDDLTSVALDVPNVAPTIVNISKFIASKFPEEMRLGDIACEIDRLLAQYFPQNTKISGKYLLDNYKKFQGYARENLSAEQKSILELFYNDITYKDVDELVFVSKMLGKRPNYIAFFLKKSIIDSDLEEKASFL